MKKYLIAFLLFAFSATVFSAEIEVSQKDKQFTEKSVSIKVGDSVKFTNEDTFFHNVFSLSDLKTFDLGSYPKGQSKTVSFDKAGTYDVECAIHPNMQMKVIVK